MACGAQNNPTENQSNPESEDIGMIADSVASLPKTIAIDFPTTLSSSSNELFNDNVKYVKNILTIEKRYLGFLHQVMANIREECKLLTKCSIAVNHFTVEENGKNILLGEIEFITNIKDKSYDNALTLAISSEEKVSFRWNSIGNDVFTLYTKDTNSLEMHYLIDTILNKEALYVEEKQVGELNTFMISLDANESKDYTLSSNHIKSGQENFSMNLLLRDEKLVENSIFEFQTMTSTLEDGTYLLLFNEKKENNITTLNLIDKLALQKGSVSLFNGEIQGHIVDEVLTDTFESNEANLSFLRLAF